MNRINPDEIMKKYFSSYNCMAHKGCGKKEIIRAHTISKKYLKGISEDNHVYYPSSSAFNKSGYLLEFKRVGLNNCSTFTGYCKYHDNILFGSFEKKDFIGKYRQIYDFSIRIVSREYFQKICLFKFFQKINSGEIKEIDSENKVGILNKIKFASRRLSECKLFYENLKKARSCGLKYILIKLKKIPLSAAGILFPATDIFGEQIQRENQKQVGVIYFILPTQKESYLCLAYPNTKKFLALNKYLNSIANVIKADKIVELLNYCLTAFIDNNDIVAFEPSWYSKLPSHFQEEINCLMNRRCQDPFEEKYNLMKILDFSAHVDFSMTSYRV